MVSMSSPGTSWKNDDGEGASKSTVQKAPRTNQKKLIPCARHADVEESPLFLDVRVFLRQGIRQEPVFNTCDEDNLEFQSFCRVECRKRDRIRPGIEIIGRDQELCFGCAKNYNNSGLS